jgi:hypothetical protein
MAKIGRNDLCPCRGGKKYKKCCALLAATVVTNPESTSPWTFDDDDFMQLTNSVVDLINERRFDEAATACQRLRTEYPEQIDWLDRSAMLYEARGDLNLACDFYRRALAFTLAPDQHDGFDEAGRDDYRTTIARLETQTLNSKTA